MAPKGLTIPILGRIHVYDPFTIWNFCNLYCGNSHGYRISYREREITMLLPANKSDRIYTIQPESGFGARLSEEEEFYIFRAANKSARMW